MRYGYLSHALRDKMQVYGGSAVMSITRVKSIKKGDSSNVSKFMMEGHWGTHVDLPNHFFDKGKRVTDYPAAFWSFKKPQVINKRLRKAQILGCGKWLSSIDPKADILILRTGWGKEKRNKVYGLANPGIHPDVGHYIRKHYPNLRAIGIDLPSISSYKDRELGRKAHRAFLDPDGKNEPVVIIEDMNLSGSLASLRRVYMAPLVVKNADSAPCTVIGVFS